MLFRSFLEKAGYMSGIKRLMHNNNFKTLNSRAATGACIFLPNAVICYHDPWKEIHPFDERILPSSHIASAPSGSFFARRPLLSRRRGDANPVDSAVFRVGFCRFFCFSRQGQSGFYGAGDHQWLFLRRVACAVQSGAVTLMGWCCSIKSMH